MENEQRPSFEEWFKSLDGKSDEEVSLAIKDMILEKGELDETSTKLFNDLYTYVVEKERNGNMLYLDELESHIIEIGYDPNEVNLPLIFMLLSFCGIYIDFEENKFKENDD